jgi:protein SERAC1
MFDSPVMMPCGGTRENPWKAHWRDPIATGGRPFQAACHYVVILWNNTPSGHTLGTLHLFEVNSVARSAATLDIIFVHGLGGSRKETWEVDGDASKYWPLWIYQDVQDANVWALEYPASMFGTSDGSLLIPDRAKQVLDLLASNDIGELPIVFVAHSLGGLIVKQLLRAAAELNKTEWETIAAKTCGVLFLGTPHNGSAIAKAAARIPFASATSIQLKDNDPHLRELNDWYQQNAPRRGYKTHAYYETKPYLSQLIVDAGSANPGIQGCVPIAFDGNHFDICKPSSRQAPIYLGARAFIQDRMNDRGVVTTSLVLAGRSDLLEPPATDALSTAAMAEYELYTTPVAEDERLDLAEKLRRGGRAHDIPRATRMKEDFAKRFVRNQLQPAATRRYINLLADVESRFNSHVYPEIVAGATNAAVSNAIRDMVIQPILATYPNDDLVNASVIDRMIFYLTGLCHIRWSA